MAEIIRGIFSLKFVRIFLVSQLITRIALSLYALKEVQISISNLPQILALGTLNDLITLSYILPLLLLALMSLSRKARSSLHFANITKVLIFIPIFILSFNFIAELIFWEEYGSRFNFIAVDYLIYTQEIIETLKSSFFLYEVLIGLVIFSSIVTLILGKLVDFRGKHKTCQHVYSFLIIVPLLCLLHNFYSSKDLNFSENRYVNELQKNGLYEFFSAFRQNSLDYNAFYPTLEEKKILEIVRSKVLQPNQYFTNHNSIIKDVNFDNQATNYNIVLITVESLSAEFLSIFGGPKELTPNLNQLANESIFFKNTFATGTRTVRGLEALTLSIPPTPGTSIVRRPKNENLITIGSILKAHNYNVEFLYGGYSYFDNMLSYFSHNGFKVVDRADIKKSDIIFANSWGVADEVLFSKSLTNADIAYKSKKPFFQFIMTTSNHRPFTFPKGRINLPNGSRYAAVKYSDYAIGAYLNEAKSKPWFDNTIFIITADHCASSAGKISLPVHKYHIPFLIYAPKILKARHINHLVSQIDIAPTILGLLKLHYKSGFFGTDAINYPANRAFIATYQILGYMKDDKLAILEPNEKPKLINISSNEEIEDQNMIEETISFYQLAYNMFVRGQLKNLDKN